MDYYGNIFYYIFCFFSLLNCLAEMIGIYYSPAALLLFLTITLVLICTQFSIIISKHSSQVRTLTQELALLKNEVDKNKKREMK